MSVAILAGMTPLEGDGQPFLTMSWKRKGDMFGTLPSASLLIEGDGRCSGAGARLAEQQ
jgi:hypothetical protein